MVNIVFTDPPPRNTSRHGMYPWDDIAEQLKARPGQWALCVTATPGQPASGITHGRYAAFRPAGSFEARSVAKGQADGRKLYDIYIRYIGSSEPSAEPEEAGQ